MPEQRKKTPCGIGLMAHVTAGIVQRHIVIQAGIDTACAQAVGDRPQAEHPVRIAESKAEKGCRSHTHTDGRDPSGSKPEGKPVAEQAGNNGAAGDDRKQDTRKGYGDGKRRIDGGPGRTQKSVGEAKADEGQVNDYQQQMERELISLSYRFKENPPEKGGFFLFIDFPPTGGSCRARRWRGERRPWRWSGWDFPHG